MRKSLPVLGLTMGDPAGIGPEICLRALCEPAVQKVCTPVLFGDVNVLKRAANKNFQANSHEVISLAQWNDMGAVQKT